MKRVLTLILSLIIILISITACNTPSNLGNSETTTGGEAASTEENTSSIYKDYADVLEEYKALLQSKANGAEIDKLPYTNNGEREHEIDVALRNTVYNINPPENLGYAIKDLNGDGEQELILLDKTYAVFALFTIDKGQVKCLDYYFEVNHCCEIDSDGRIYKEGYGKGKNVYFLVQTISDGKLVVELQFRCNQADLDVLELEYYKTVSGVKTVISEEEYNQLQAEYSHVFANAHETTKTSGMQFNYVLPNEGENLSPNG